MRAKAFPIDTLLKRYQNFVDSGVSLDPDNADQRKLLACMGLAGETGEVIEHIKKQAFHGKYLDRGEVILELGDVFWYYTLLLRTMNITLDEVVAGNVAKLKARHPGRHGA